MRRSGRAAPRAATPGSAFAVRQGVAVGVATAAYGVSFGALSVAAGFSVWQTCVLSLLMFTGGSQFALIGVIATAGLAGAPAAIASAAMLGSRNAIYGLRMRPELKAGWWTLGAAWFTIDESVAVALAQPPGRVRRIGFWVTGAVVFAGWNLTTLLGGLLGGLLADPKVYGLDAAAAAAFLGLLWPRLVKRQAIAVGIGAALVAVAVTPVLTPGLPVIIAALVAVVVGVANWFRPPQQTPLTGEAS